MANDVDNVLVGVATLAIRQPNDALASWSTEKKQAGTYSVKLEKKGTGNAGSTHLQITPRDAAITFATWATQVAANGYTYYYFRNAVAGGFWEQIEFRFEDPDSDAWIEVTVAPAQGVLGSALWTAKDLADDDPIGFGGVNEVGLSFSDWGMTWVPSTVLAEVSGTHAVGTADNWLLTRVRFELWEPAVARAMYIDTIVLDGDAYTVEPGDSSMEGAVLSAPYVDVGYTEDGVNFNYSSDVTLVRVHEATFPVGAKLKQEGMEIVCNMAEGSLININNAIAGAVLSGNKLTIGGGVIKEMSIKLTGITPGGFIRSYEFPRVVATGAVGVKFIKDDKSIIPLTLTVLQPSTGDVGTFVDNTA